MVDPVQLIGVSKRYGPRGPWVLRGVDLELVPGSLTRVDGANGSGKSTLLALIAGIHRPNRGRISGGGRRAYVPERLPAVLPYDVTGYLDRLGAAHGLPPDASRQRSAYWLARLGAAAWASAPMAALSAGTVQKVAIAQALMADADLLVLDEAWRGLDADARAVLDEAITERLATGTTVVFVDHQHTARSARAADVLVVRNAAVLRGVRGRAAHTALPDIVEIEFDDGSEVHALHVPVTASDDALRDVLARPGCHVRSVRTVAGAR